MTESRTPRLLWLLVLVSLAANAWLAWRVSVVDEERWAGDEILQDNNTAQDRRLDALEAAQD